MGADGRANNATVLPAGSTALIFVHKYAPVDAVTAETEPARISRSYGATKFAILTAEALDATVDLYKSKDATGESKVPAII